jgi:dihydroneopterin aldolase / 2-amino-4-hydroxy-6-hydroxymethyldihydropteridine diphosphokinase
MENNSAGREAPGHIAYLGVGSNIGDRMGNIRRAEDHINSSETSRVTGISKIYETEPYGYVKQDNFLNCSFQIATLLDPVSLMRFLLGIEDKLKRERIIHWGPRTIDLDILFYDDRISLLKEVILPHPRLHERKFVLKPLCDIAPDFIHPIIKKSCIWLLESLGDEESDPVEWSGV